MLSGIYARVSVSFVLYEASGNRGVGFGLGAVSVR
ncbi:MAG: ssDNA-binding protein [Butyricicoccus sp.]